MDKRSFLATHPLFRMLSAEAREKLSGFARERTMHEGEVLFRRGDDGVGMLAVIEGAVRVSLPSAEGRDRTLARFHEGEVFGEIALLDGKSRTADATAISDGRLLEFQRRDLLPILRAAPELGMSLIELLCDRLRRTSDQVEEQSFLDLPTRLARTLLRLVGPDGRIAMTQSEIAELVGATRESVNRRLRGWEEAGTLEISKGALVLRRRDALEAVANGHVTAAK